MDICIHTNNKTPQVHDCLVAQSLEGVPSPLLAAEAAGVAWPRAFM